MNFSELDRVKCSEAYWSSWWLVTTVVGSAVVIVKRIYSVEDLLAYVAKIRGEDPECDIHLEFINNDVPFRGRLW